MAAVPVVHVVMAPQASAFLTPSSLRRGPGPWNRSASPSRPSPPTLPLPRLALLRLNKLRTPVSSKHKPCADCSHATRALHTAHMGTDNGTKRWHRRSGLIALVTGMLGGAAVLALLYAETPIDFSSLVNVDFSGIDDDSAALDLGRRGVSPAPPSNTATGNTDAVSNGTSAAQTTKASTSAQKRGPCFGVPWGDQGFTFQPPENEEEPWSERWYGGAVQRGVEQPYEGKWSIDLSETRYNQLNPVLLSTFGRWIWSETPRRIQISPTRPKSGILCVEGSREGFDSGVALGGGLKGAFKQASSRHFPPTGVVPDADLFTSPQYNLWIELLYTPTQEAVLEYAKSAISHGFPPGVLMIDTNWAERYGSFAFDSARFPDPKAMTDELHEMGFKVMVWVTPFVSPDSVEFRHLRALSYLVKNSWGGVGIPEWWDGHSALVDFMNPEAAAWYKGELDKLQSEYGIDGFKFDGGDPEYYRQLGGEAAERSLEHLEAFNRVGLHYNSSEYRAAWKMAGNHLAMRLSDKAHAWGINGLSALLPNGIAQGLSGYAFTCPDMIGGGQYGDFVEVRRLPLKDALARVSNHPHTYT